MPSSVRDVIFQFPQLCAKANELRDLSVFRRGDERELQGGSGLLMVVLAEIGGERMIVQLDRRPRPLAGPWGSGDEPGD